MRRPKIPAIADNAVLTKDELREALLISEDLLEDLIREGLIPVAHLRKTVPRFIWGQVVRALERLAVPDSSHLRAVG